MVFAEHMLLVALQVPPAFSHAARVLYWLIVPDDVPVEGLADGPPRSTLEPLDGAEVPAPAEVSELPEVLPPTLEPVPDVPIPPLVLPAPVLPAPELLPAPLLPELLACPAASAGARPITATRNAKMTFFNGTSLGIEAAASGEQERGPRMPSHE